MNILKIAIASSILTSTFLTGAIVGQIIKNKDIINKLKKMTIKKNMSASSKENQD